MGVQLAIEALSMPDFYSFDVLVPSAVGVVILLIFVLFVVGKSSSEPDPGPAQVSSQSQIKRFRAKVIWIVDGDTLKIRKLDTEEVIRIRLADIDAPEDDQPHGVSSSVALHRMCFGKIVDIAARDVDQYGRTIATIFIEGKSINKIMVRLGHAWSMRECFLYDSTMLSAEQYARSRKSGLWRLPDEKITPPWEWRRNNSADRRKAYE